MMKSLKCLLMFHAVLFGTVSCRLLGVEPQHGDEATRQLHDGVTVNVNVDNRRGNPSSVGDNTYSGDIDTYSGYEEESQYEDIDEDNDKEIGGIAEIGEEDSRGRDVVYGNDNYGEDDVYGDDEYGEEESNDDYSEDDVYGDDEYGEDDTGNDDYGEDGVYGGDKYGEEDIDDGYYEAKVGEEDAGNDEVDFCWKDWVARGGKMKFPNECPEGYTFKGGLDGCVKHCPSGMYRLNNIAPNCIYKCPDGWIDEQKTLAKNICAKKPRKPQGRHGYIWKKKCGSDCEKCGLMGWCKPCPAGMEPDWAKAYCVEKEVDCSSIPGMDTRHSINKYACWKKPRQKIQTTKPTCGAGEKNLFMCYSEKCPEGYNGVGPTCLENLSRAPPGFVDCGSGFAKNSQICGRKIVKKTTAVFDTAFNFAGVVLDFIGDLTGSPKVKVAGEVLDKVQDIYEEAKNGLGKAIDADDLSPETQAIVKGKEDPNDLTGEEAIKASAEVIFKAFDYPKCKEVF